MKLTLIGEAANKYKLRDGEEEFTISGTINKAVPHPTVSISKAVCATDEKLLPLLSIEGVQKDAAVTYYYTPTASSIYDDTFASLNVEINKDTVIDEPGTYYIFARTAATKNYEAAASEAVMLIVSNDVASVVSADGTETKYTALGFALEAANADDIARLLANIGGSFDIYKPITLDLNGKNWSGTATIRAGAAHLS